MQETIKTKFCNKCQTEKSVELFYKDNREKDGLRYQCKECNRAYQQANRQANAEKIAEYQKAYQQANTEKLVYQKRAYYQANAEKLAEYQKAYQQANPEKIAERVKVYQKTPTYKASQKNARHKRRTITKQGDVTTQQLLDLTTKAKECYWCNTSLKNKSTHIDHYIPLSKGGEHTLNNLVVSCSKCNLTKHTKDPIKFANSIGKLL